MLRFWRLLPRAIQLPIIKLVQLNKPLYRSMLFRHIAAKDRLNGNHTHLPPPELRYRVSASPDADEFVAVGKRCATDIQSAVQKAGCEFDSFQRILDFGCGCGRTLVHVKDLAPNAQIDGTDIDAEAIEWCKQNLKFASFSLSKETPPIEYAADTFDFIYAISVFTHLDEDYQFRWLDELRRIAKPGAVLLLTVDSSRVGEKDFVFQRSYEEGLFPAWYQNAFHSRDYVFENFGKYFEVIGHFPRALNNMQDVVLLRKD